MAHSRARHIRHQRAPAGSDREGELGDRARLVDHQPRRPAPGSPVLQAFQVRLVVSHGTGEQALPFVVEAAGEVLALANIQPDPHIHLRRCGNQDLFFHCSAWSGAREGRP